MVVAKGVPTLLYLWSSNRTRIASEAAVLSRDLMLVSQQHEQRPARAGG